MSRPRASEHADYGLVYLQVIVAFHEGRITLEQTGDVLHGYGTALEQYRNGTFDSRTIPAPSVFGSFDVEPWRRHLESFIDGIEKVEAKRIKNRTEPKPPVSATETANETGVSATETANETGTKEKKREEKGLKEIKTEAEDKEEAFRPSVSVSVFKGELSYSAFQNPDNDPVSLAMRLCEVEDLAEREAKKYKDAGKKEAEKAAVLLRNWNTFQKQLRLKGEVVFRNALEKAFGEKQQGEWDSVENPASLFTERLGKYPDKPEGPRPSKTPANRTETDKQTPTDLKAQTATLAKSLFNHPRQANGSQAEAVGFEAELLSYAEKNGITLADGKRCDPVLSELFKLGYGEALNKLSTLAKYAFACRFLDEEKERNYLLARLAGSNQKPTKQGADDGEEMPF